MAHQDKLNILFVCSGNSFRSQIAEAWGKELLSERYNFFSAGTKPHAINPRAIEVMAEAGVDISAYRSKAIADLDAEMDVVITVCSKARETCPLVHGASRILHVDIDAPSALAREAANESEAFGVYCRVRDDIRAFVEHIDRYLN